MKSKQTNKRVYVCPKATVITVESDYLMQIASGNAGTIGAGGQGGDAKRWSSAWEDEEDGDGEIGGKVGFKPWEE